MKEFLFQGRREGAYKKKKEELLLEVAPKKFYSKGGGLSQKERKKFKNACWNIQRNDVY